MKNSETQAGTIDRIHELISQGYVLRGKGESLEAKKIFLKAVHASRDLGDQDSITLTDQDSSASTDQDSSALKEQGRNGKRVLAEALKGLGQLERDLGEIPAALQHYQESAELYRSLDDPLTLAHTVRHVADIMRQHGDHVPAASAFYDEALMIYRDHAETKPLDLANTLRGYALLKAESGHREAAVAFWQEARELYEKAGTETGLDLQSAYEECDRQIEQLSKASSQSEP